MENLDLECVASFLVLVEEANFSRAASRLFLTPTALTRRLQKLERQVGVRLFERDHLGASGPTPAGRRFAAAGEALLQLATAARQEALASEVRRGRHPPRCEPTPTFPSR